MSSTTHDDRPRLELYVRSLSPSGARSRQDAVISRLSALTERDVIAGYDVHVWGTGICPASPAVRTESGTFALERLSAFEDWAERNGLTLDGTFRTVDVASEITGESYTEISFPVLALAEFAGPDLRRVAPCRDGETTYSVEDCLDAIEGGWTLEADSSTRSTVPTGRIDPTESQPVDFGTDGPFENGTGVLAAPDRTEERR